MNNNGTQHENLSARAVLLQEETADDQISGHQTSRNQTSRNQTSRNQTSRNQTSRSSMLYAASLYSPLLYSPLLYSPLLYLASASPRRAQILHTLGVPFRVVNSSFEEPSPDQDDHAQPAQFVEQLAREKAKAAQVKDDDALVLAADTVVWHDGTILGKPRDASEAIAMLERLRGQEHWVLTGVCLRWRNRGKIEYSTLHERTRVVFNDVSDSWIRAYVATGEPLDKAGSYGAQDKGALLVQRIDGDFWNVVGLPLAPLSQLLAAAGMPIEKYWEENAANRTQ